MIKTMSSKMTTNSQLSTTEPKTKQKQTKQTTRTGTESQKWRSHEGTSAGKGRGEWEKGTENQYKWQGENTQRKVKNSIGNVEAKELTCVTHGHELRVGMLQGAEGNKGEKKMGQL